jgi:hypothetical protein
VGAGRGGDAQVADLVEMTDGAEGIVTAVRERVTRRRRG